MGTFLLLGSGEFEPWAHDVEALALGGAVGDGSVAILPTASAPDGDAVFDRWARMGLEHFAQACRVASRSTSRTSLPALRSLQRSFGGWKGERSTPAARRAPWWPAAPRDGRGGSSWLFGLGLVPTASFGAHWDKVRRLPGAAWWMTSRVPEGTWFVGIDERTAILGDGRAWAVHGSGGVDVRCGTSRTRAEAGESFTTVAGSAGRQASR